jgi:hypothetical protein
VSAPKLPGWRFLTILTLAFISKEGSSKMFAFVSACSTKSLEFAVSW